MPPANVKRVRLSWQEINSSKDGEDKLSLTLKKTSPGILAACASCSC